MDPSECFGDLGGVNQILQQLKELQVVNLGMNSVFWQEQVFVLHLKLDLREVQVLPPLIRI